MGRGLGRGGYRVGVDGDACSGRGSGRWEDKTRVQDVRMALKIMLKRGILGAGRAGTERGFRRARASGRGASVNKLDSASNRVMGGVIIVGGRVGGRR